jgi:hypothetical protein
MNKRLLFFTMLVLTASTFLGRTVAACDLCAIYNAINATGEGGTGWTTGVAEQFTYFGSVQTDGVSAPNPDGQYLSSSVTQLFANYDFNNKIGLQVTVPIIYRAYKRPTLTGVETGTVSGAGDMSIIGRFMPYERYTENFSFNSHLMAGLKLPTGSASLLREELTEVETTPPNGIHGHDLTLGSGSVDGIVGGNAFVRWHYFLGIADLQYAIRSAGEIDYRFANDLNWGVSLGSYLFLKDAYTLALLLKTSGEYKGLDDLDGVTVDDTGVNYIYMGPDVLYTWKNHLSVDAGADLPVLLSNTGFQAVPDWRIHSAVTWHF